MQALLMTKFPTSLIENNVKPRLLARGIEVTAVLDSDRAKSIPPGDYPLVLFMHEMASHNQWASAKELTLKAGKRFFELSRKSASWPDDLRDTTVAIEQRTPQVRPPPEGHPPGEPEKKR